ncbi:unnamed protein product, partial [Rotaria sp. Silwood1]
TVVNDVTLIIIAKDDVKPSRSPTHWNLFEVLISAIIYGIYLSLSTIIFLTIILKTRFFQDKFGVKEFQYRNSDVTNPGWNDPILHSIIYLQISIINQALIFLTRSRYS